MQELPVHVERMVAQPRKSCACDDRPNREADRLTVEVDGSISKPHGTGKCHDDPVAVPEYGAENNILVQRCTDTIKQVVLTHAG
jgi:hypothetical protein